MGRGPAWPRRDEDVLTKAWNEGGTVNEIAELLGRTGESVRARASRLGLSVSRRDEVVREALELRRSLPGVLAKMYEDSWNAAAAEGSSIGAQQHCAGRCHALRALATALGFELDG